MLDYNSLSDFYSDIYDGRFSRYNSFNYLANDRAYHVDKRLFISDFYQYAEAVANNNCSSQTLHNNLVCQPKIVLTDLSSLDITFYNNNFKDRHFICTFGADYCEGSIFNHTGFINYDVVFGETMVITASQTISTLATNSSIWYNCNIYNPNLLNSILNNNLYNCILTNYSFWNLSISDLSGDDDEDCRDFRYGCIDNTLRITIINALEQVFVFDLPLACNSDGALRSFNLSDYQNLSLSSHGISGLFNSIIMGNTPVRVAYKLLDNTCVYGDGIVSIKGILQGQTYSPEEVSGRLGIKIDDVLGDCIIGQASFVTCCNYPDSYSSNISEVLEEITSDVDGSMFMLKIGDVEVTGFECLESFCCDDSDCPLEEEQEITIPPLIPGSGGGGVNVDISCICDNLLLLKSGLENKLDGIKNSIDNLSIDLEVPDCICDNLEGIKEAIEDKELEVTVEPPNVNVNPQITVEPCEPPNVTVNPQINVQPSQPPNVTVNPPDITVQSPSVSVEAPNVTVTPQITVEPCSPVVTQPVNNITVTPATVDINQDINLEGLECDGESLACIIKKGLIHNVNKGDGNIEKQGLAQIAYEKDLNPINETIVEPCDYTYCRKANIDSVYDE